MLTTILKSLISVSRLRQHPTHMLRTDAQGSTALPVIVHENRTLLSITRLLSGDSRINIVNAIETTLAIVRDVIRLETNDTPPYLTTFRREIAILNDQFIDGLTTLEKHYESDVSVCISVQSMQTKWKDIQDILAASSPPAARSSPINIETEQKEENDNIYAYSAPLRSRGDEDDMSNS